MSPIRPTRIYTLLFLLALFLTGGCRRGGWIEVRSGPPAPKMEWRFLSAPLHDIWTPDGRQIWAVGTAGVVIHSSDGGSVWELQENVEAEFLMSVHGTPDGQRIWAVGSNGRFVRSRDKGRSWSSLQLPDKPALIGVHGSRDGQTLRAFDIHGQEHRSFDGGETWKQPSNQPLSALLKAETPDENNTLNLRDLAVSEDGEQLLAVGMEGLFAYSLNRGEHWTIQRLENRPHLLRIGISQDGSKVIVHGRQDNSTTSYIWLGGITPSKSYLFQSPMPTSDEVLTALFMDLHDRAWVADSSGRIYAGPWTSEAWEDRDPLLSYPWRFAAAEAGAFWAVGTGHLGTRVIRSHDQGATWKSQTIHIEPAAIAAASDGLWIYGINGQLIHCTPECSLLQHQPSIRQGYVSGRIGVLNEQIWIVEGDTLFTSQDDGSSWRSQKVKGAQALGDYFRSNAGDWLLDRSGQIFHSPQRSFAWSLHSHLPFVSLTTSAVDLLGFNLEDGLILFAVDSGGGLWRESSSKEWAKIYDSEQLFMSADGTPDGNHLWLTGGILNALTYSADLGTNWNREPYLTRMGFTSVSVSPNGLSVLAVGRGSMLFGRASGAYPRVLETRLSIDPSILSAARLELRIEGSPNAVTLRCGSKRDLSRGQLSKIESTLIRPEEGSDVWAIKFNPLSQSIGLRPGEDLYAEVTLETKNTSKDEMIPSEAQVFRQTFRLPPLAYEPWWQKSGVLPIVAYLAWLMLLTILYVLWPVSLFRIQRFLAILDLSRFLASIPLMGPPAKLFLETAGALPLVARTQRALDAWVESHRDAIRKRFEAEEIIPRSRGYISLPVRINSSLNDRPDAQTFSRFFSPRRTLIQVVGVGGAGKTMLAIQIARWALAGKDEGGLKRKPMLPVLIDEDTQDLRAVVKRKLTSWLQEEISDDLLNALLRKKRILVIVDRVSERESSTREHLRTLHGSQPVNALMVTTRQPLDFEAGGSILVHPQPLGSETLLHFMTSLLQDPSRSGAFQTMRGQIDLAQRLADLIRLGDEEIPLTPLLARLYVDKAVELAKAGATLDDLPTSIPDVYFDYLRSVNPPGGLSDPDMLRAAEALADLALEKGFVPHEILRLEAQKALAAAGWKDTGVPDSILQRLRDNGVVQETNVGTEVLLRFVLDPVAEFLAAMAHAKRCGERESAWETLALKIDQAGKQASGFRLALRLVCDAYGKRLGWACSEAMSRLTQEPPLP